MFARWRPRVASQSLTDFILCHEVSKMNHCPISGSDFRGLEAEKKNLPLLKQDAQVQTSKFWPTDATFLGRVGTEPFLRPVLTNYVTLRHILGNGRPPSQMRDPGHDQPGLAQRAEAGGNC